MEPILRLKRIRTEDNFLGFRRIDIYAFNFDGEGSALVRFDDSSAIDTLSEDDLHDALCGDPGDGTLFYVDASLPGPEFPE